jgi:uncharacterized protein (TIGR04222 family)
MMSFLSANFIADMYGPTFLAFYALVILAVIGAARWRVWSSDRTHEEQGDNFPDPPDPIDVALLRGDVTEVLRLTVVELVHRGYLRVRDSRFLGIRTGEKISHAANPPDAQHLSPLQRAVFDRFHLPTAAADLFDDGSLQEYVRSRCLEAERRLQDHRLITPAEVKRTALKTAVFASMVVLGLGGYKLAVALAKGKSNVGFLIGMAIVGVVLVALASTAPRISRRGKAYLARLRDRYARLKHGISSLNQPVDDSALVFAVALFGLPALEGTPYQGLVSTFRKTSSESSGGAGCGGGGGGGGGCGGGCGGCGGGG